MSFIFSAKDTYRQAVEAATGGKNTVLYDDKGNPSIMVVIPRFNMSDVIPGAPDEPHPAFVVNGVTKDALYVSKYQNVVHDSRAYSLPLQDPGVYTTFDQAVTYCKNKGDGWHLMTNAEWAALALWCKQNGYMPRGNNNYGKDHTAAWERGLETYETGGQTGRIATGSGPKSWAHDDSNDGIFDLNGNVWEWVGGMRLQSGEIQIIPDNDAALPTADMSSVSTQWKAIAAADGAIVEPGTAGTLKWDYVGGKIQLCSTITVQADASRSNSFETTTVEASVTPPNIVKALGLHPIDASHGGDYLYMNNGAGLERLPYRGGNWGNTADAGVFALRLRDPRADSGNGIGFRSAFVL